MVDPLHLHLMKVFSVSAVDRMCTSLTMMTTSKTTRLQDNTNHKGLALFGHITLDVTARWWVQVDTHGAPAPQRREAVGSPKPHKRLQAADKTQTLTWWRRRSSDGAWRQEHVHESTTDQGKTMSRYRRCNSSRFS